MSIWSATSRGSLVAVLCSGLAVLPTAAASSKDNKPKDNKPTIAIKSAPAMGFAPFRVVLTVDVKGGPDDYEQYYCATAEWDMLRIPLRRKCQRSPRPCHYTPQPRRATASRQILRPMAGAMILSSAIKRSNWPGKSDCAPSLNA